MACFTFEATGVLNMTAFAHPLSNTSAPTALSTGYKNKILLLHRCDLQKQRSGSGHESSMMTLFVNSTLSLKSKEEITTSFPNDIKSIT